MHSSMFAAVLFTGATAASLRWHRPSTTASTQLERLTSLSDAVQVFSKSASTNPTSVTPAVASTSTVPDSQRFARMGVNEAEHIKERIQMERTKLHKIQHLIQDVKTKKTNAPTPTTSTDAAANNKQASASTLNDVPSDRPLRKEEAKKIQSMARTTDESLHAVNRFGSTRVSNFAFFVSLQYLLLYVVAWRLLVETASIY